MCRGTYVWGGGGMHICIGIYVCICRKGVEGGPVGSNYIASDLEFILVRSHLVVSGTWKLNSF